MTLVDCGVEQDVNPILFPGFYDSLITLASDLIRQGAVMESIHNLFDVVDSVNDKKVLDYLNATHNSEI